MITLPAAPHPAPSAAGVPSSDGGIAMPLAAPLRLNLAAALGLDASAPDFAARNSRAAGDNDPYNFEHTARGELIIVPLTGWDSNIGENEPNVDLVLWRRATGTGHVMSQTVPFRLPSGAGHIPDAAWFTPERYDALRSLPPGERTSAVPGAPDFVVEVRSRTDRLPDGLARMAEWLDGGARLGWYIDPYARHVHIYRAGQDVETLADPESLSGEDVLPGFTFAARQRVVDRYRYAQL